MMKLIAFACLLATVIASDEWKKVPTPVFLIGASDTVKENFYDIITRDWTTEQKDKAIDQLVAQLDTKFQDAYAKFKIEIAEIKAKYGKAVEDQV